MSVIPVHVQGVSSIPLSLPADRNASRRYFVALALPVVAGLVLVFAVFAWARTEAAFSRFGSFHEFITAWKTDQLPKHDADIVVVGDSTGLVGIVPKIIEQETGMRTYHLALTVGPFVASGTDLLDAYLQVNRAPKLIILYLNPWTTPSRPDDMVSEADLFGPQFPSFEATFALDKIGNWQAMGRYLMAYPEQAAIFVRRVASRLIRGEPGAQQRSSAIREILSQNGGWLPFARGLAGVDHLPSLPADCVFAERHVTPDLTYFRSFRQRYTTFGTRVVVLLAPIPECDRSLHLLQVAYAGLVDLPPAAMANRYFVREPPRRSHLLEVGAETNTHNLAVALKHFFATGPAS